MLLAPIANNSSMGQISSLPIHMSTIKVNLTITGEVVVISADVSPTISKIFNTY